MLEPQTSAKLDFVELSKEEKSFYFIKWRIDGKEYTNHYFTNVIDVDFKAYVRDMEKCGYMEFSE